jgi:ABC-type nitrate/sulfonate/bicarbonate transport system substrate-binding protein
MIRLALTVAALLLACGNAARASDTVRFGIDANSLGAQVWVASDRGYFARHGVDPQIVTFALGVDAVDATLTGRVDVATALDFPVAMRLRSNQLLIISSIMEPETGFHKLAVNASIRTPADLAGKRIGDVRATAQSVVTAAYLEHYHIAPSAVTLVPMQDLFDEIAALRAHRLDAAFVWANGVPQALLIPGVRILSDDSAANVHAFGYLVTNVRYARAHALPLERVLMALSEATAYIHAHHRDAAALVAAHVHAPVDSLDAVMQQSNYTISLKPQDRTSFITLATFASQTAPVKTPIDPSAAFDPEFLQHAVPAADTLRL